MLHCLKRLPLVVILIAAAWPPSAAFARDLSKLDILNQNYPRAFFFRATEGAYSERRYPTFESWERQFDRLQGIIGKCLEEECLGRQPRNPEFFSKFKQRHPNQVVLLHFNGNARDPRYHTEKYFPGHWVYRKATSITKDVAAESGQTVIHVQDARDFHINAGRYKTSNDDIALFGITADGRHDWNHCEQVQLINIDSKKNTITVKRGCYGTVPLAFPAGQSRAAAHAVEGPWGQNNHIMWFYNFATHCPKDPEGKTCTDRLVDDLAEWFGPKGPLAAFDGLEFDVMHNQTSGDTDGDGVIDNGVIDGINQYGIGMVEFARQLRQRMTDQFIIQGDGALGPGGRRSQRAWHLLNGIESEGWPNLGDWEFDDWSGGLNRHFFWRDNAREPVFNYVNHKWNQAVPGKPGARKNPDVPFSRHRLSLAACQYFDAMTCYSFAPPPDPDGLFGIWDELRCGTDRKVGWLGKPDGPAVRMAWQTKNLMADSDTVAALAKRVSGSVVATVTPAGVRITPRSADADQVRFAIRSIPTDGADLTVSVVMAAEPMTGYPKEMARFGEVGVSGGQTSLLAVPLLETGMKLRGGSTEVPLDSDTGASVRIQRREIGDVTLPTVFVHPPYRDATGYAFWTQEADIPQNGELHFSLGMGELSPQRSDGVWFKVFAADMTTGKTGPYRQIFESSTKEHRWIPHVVSLADDAGKRLRLKFVADCGPSNNATTDHAYWGDVRIMTAGTSSKQITRLQQTMTWINDRPFESTFYYHEIQSDAVNLSFVVEGKEAVVLKSAAAYAHPDAMYRIFEHGIVLANPSRKPYTFDLDRLSPNRRYRRIQATSRQDTTTNNGQPVRGKVTLGERDALFLVRTR